MSGYTGNPDAESEHALILNENGIEACREVLQGRVLLHCVDCGDVIPKARVAFLASKDIKCERCIGCQEVEDKLPKRSIKMLDRIL